MLRFIKQNLETISGVGIFPMISLLIFVTFFVIVLIRVRKMSKSSVSEISSYPLNDDINEENNFSQQQN
jgi:hypothetical protein